MDNNQWYDPNNVDADSFNETMRGYVKYALRDVEESLKNKGFNNEQIEDFKVSFRGSLNWAIDMMTMEQARKYYNK